MIIQKIEDGGGHSLSFYFEDRGRLTVQLDCNGEAYSFEEMELDKGDVTWLIAYLQNIVKDMRNG
jgi:hypothetical protein